MLIAGLILGTAITIFAFSRSYPLSIGMMVIMGMGQTGHILMGSILLQTLSDKEYVGRVMSILLMCGATASLGTFFAGIITQFVGAPIAVGACGILMVLSTVVCLLFLPWTRKID